VLALGRDTLASPKQNRLHDGSQVDCVTKGRANDPTAIPPCEHDVAGKPAENRRRLDQFTHAIARLASDRTVKGKAHTEPLLCTWPAKEVRARAWSSVKLPIVAPYPITLGGRSSLGALKCAGAVSRNQRSAFLMY